MAATYINKVDNANVYIDGNSLLGKAKTFKAPEIEIEFVEHKNLGMVGVVKLPAGVKAMEGEVTWDGFYPEVAAIGANPFKSHQIMVRANTSVYNAAGRVAEAPLVFTMNVMFATIPNGEYNAQENAEYTHKYTASSIKCSIDNKEVLFFDAFTNAYRVAGEDILAKYRSNIGG